MSDLHTHECDFYTQSVVLTRSRVIPTSLSVIFTQIERFPHVKCDTHECNLNKLDCGFDTYETHEQGFLSPLYFYNVTA
jgi:hypothetical protein